MISDRSGIFWTGPTKAPASIGLSQTHLSDLQSELVDRALSMASTGVAILALTVCLEGVGRYRGIFQERPPAIFAQFSERVPIVKGRLDRRASTATGYAWFVWLPAASDEPRLAWTPLS